MNMTAVTSERNLTRENANHPAEGTDIPLPIHRRYTVATGTVPTNTIDIVNNTVVPQIIIVANDKVVIRGNLNENGLKTMATTKITKEKAKGGSRRAKSGGANIICQRNQQATVQIAQRFLCGDCTVLQRKLQ